MTRFERYANIVSVLFPPVGLIVGGVLLWNTFLSWRDLAIFAVMYALTAGGVTVGFHRLLSHRSFQTKRWIKTLLAICGSMSVQGPVLEWVTDHRKHHTFADEEGDPHSPHLGRPPGIKGLLGGLWYAHMGWLFATRGQASTRRFAPDLLRDPTLRAINRSFNKLVLAGLLIPFLLGFALSGGSSTAGFSALFWGGFVRIFLLHHVTWSINSICHFHGKRRFALQDYSTNVFWLAVPSLGEAWHHNHHAFPTSAFHGLRWWEIDISGLVISALERLGLAWDVVRISTEKQQEKLTSALPQAAPAP